MRIANADSVRVYLARSIGEHAAPGDGHPEHLDADRLRGGNVPSKAVVEVVSNRACISVEYLAWLCRKGVPDAGAPAI